MIGSLTNGRYLYSGMPCSYTNEDGVKNVTSLEEVNPVFCLFDYLIVWICPSLPTKDVHTEALACIYEGAMRADLKKKKRNKAEHGESSPGDMVYLLESILFLSQATG